MRMLALTMREPNHVREFHDGQSTVSRALQYGPELLPDGCDAFTLAAVRQITRRTLDMYLPSRVTLDPELDSDSAQRPIDSDPRRGALIHGLFASWSLVAVSFAYSLLYPLLATAHALSITQTPIPLINLLPIVVYAILLTAALAEARHIARYSVAMWHILLPGRQISGGTENARQIVQAIQADYQSSGRRAATMRHLREMSLLPLPLSRIVAAYLQDIERRITPHDVLRFGPVNWKLSATCAFSFINSEMFEAMRLQHETQRL